MFYVYVLRSRKDGKNYTGFTKNLKLRFERHNKGLVESTRERLPFEIIYYEACISQEDAIKREKYLKTIYGKRYIKKRLESYLTGRVGQKVTVKRIRGGVEVKDWRR